MWATGLQSSGASCVTGGQHSTVAPEDLAALAAQILKGLQPQLAAAMRQGLEQLLQEQERRLLSVLVPERIQGSRTSSIGARTSNLAGQMTTPASRIESPLRCFTAPDLRKKTLSPGSRSSGPTEARRRHRSTGHKSSLTATESQRERTTLRSLVFWRRPTVDSNLPTGLNSLGEARDNDLLAPWQDDPEMPCEQPTSHGITKKKDSLGRGSSLGPAGIEGTEGHSPVKSSHKEHGSAAEVAAGAYTGNASADQDHPMHTLHRPMEQETLSASDRAGFPSAGLPAGRKSRELCTLTVPRPFAAFEATASISESPEAAAGSAVLEGGSPRTWPFCPSMLRFFSLGTFTDTQRVQLQREDELLRVTELSRTSSSILPVDRNAIPISRTATYMVQMVNSPLLLRLCGILPWGGCGALYHCGILLLAAGLVGILMWLFVRNQGCQSQTMQNEYCLMGVCMHISDLVHLSDLVLAVGSLLGLLTMRSLPKLLGSPRTLLPRYAKQHDVVWKWCRASWCQLLGLAVLWAGSVACRAVTMAEDPGLDSVAGSCVFALASLLFVALVFGVMHVSCLICILIDSYAMQVQESMDLASNLQEWDRLGALIRKVCRAVELGFLLVQATAMILLLYSFIVFLSADGAKFVWWLASNMLLAQSLLLLLCKAAEVTEMCKRVPSVINALDYPGGSGLSWDKPYLVEHITHSAAGFYLFKVRLTNAMVLKSLYLCIVAVSFSVTKVPTITTA